MKLRTDTQQLVASILAATAVFGFVFYVKGRKKESA